MLVTLINYAFGQECQQKQMTSCKVWPLEWDLSDCLCILAEIAWKIWCVLINYIYIYIYDLFFFFKWRAISFEMINCDFKNNFFLLFCLLSDKQIYRFYLHIQNGFDMTYLTIYCAFKIDYGIPPKHCDNRKLRSLWFLSIVMTY